MSYISIQFLFFVVFLLIVYYLFCKKYKWIVLLIGSLIFYYLFSSKYIIFILFSTLITYLFGILNTKYQKKKILVFLPILINLSLLLFSKYNLFITENISKIFSFNITFKQFIIPIGISYYTLDMIGYIVDIYRNKFTGERNYFKLLLYFCYFPKIVQGPICRYNDLSVKLFESKKFKWENLKNSLLLICYGLIKKVVIANRLGVFVDNFFSNNSGGLLLFLALIFFTIQLYTDFSGGIDIVRGTSGLFEVSLPKNFERPFFSKNIQEFWQRWHVSLGEWLKEYIFFPISLSKMNMKVNSQLKKMNLKKISRFFMISFPLVFVWITTGLWHAISLKFIIYGMYYYILLILGITFKPAINLIIDKFKINVKSSKFVFFQIIKTLLFVLFGMFIFRCNSINQMFLMLSDSLNGVENIFSYGLNIFDLFIALIIFGIIMIIEYFEEFKNINILDFINKKTIIFRLSVYLFLIILLIFGFYDNKFFIYGAF